MFVKITESNSTTPTILNLAHVISIEAAPETVSDRRQIVFQTPAGSFYVFVDKNDVAAWLESFARYLTDALRVGPDYVMDVTDWQEFTTGGHPKRNTHEQSKRLA